MVDRLTLPRGFTMNMCETPGFMGSGRRSESKLQFLKGTGERKRLNVFDLFRPVIPTDVGRLDYLERQVIIDAERGDWSAVSTEWRR